MAAIRCGTLIARTCRRRIFTGEMLRRLGHRLPMTVVMVAAIFMVMSSSATVVAMLRHSAGRQCTERRQRLAVGQLAFDDVVLFLLRLAGQTIAGTTLGGRCWRRTRADRRLVTLAIASAAAVDDFTTLRIGVVQEGVVFGVGAHAQ